MEKLVKRSFSTTARAETFHGHPLSVWALLAGGGTQACFSTTKFANQAEKEAGVGVASSLTPQDVHSHTPAAL
eukprot:1159417-Pelagomonas_calceolata.AAC.6